MPKYWFVECRFHDPVYATKYPSGFQYRKKFSGDTLADLKLTAEIYKEEMEQQLDVLHFNPITKMHMADRSGLLHPGLLFSDALQKSYEKLLPDYSEHHAKQIRCAIVRIKKAEYKARVDSLLISQVKTWHIKNLLDELNLTNSVYNKFRSYLLGLFKELVQYGCIESNPIRDISKKNEVKNIREVLTDEKMEIVYNYLQEKRYPFFRYTKIFFYSGARSAELLRIQKKHVDLDRQEYRVLIKKRKSYEWVTKIIIPAAVPYWREILDLCKSDEDYIFSKFQLPAKTPINPIQITRKWARIVKSADDIADENGAPIKITEDFYAFKHLFLDKMDELENQAPIYSINSKAQRMASHQDQSTTEIYTVGKKARKNDDLKRLAFR